MENGKYSRSIKPIYLTGDLFCLNAAYFISYFARFKHITEQFDVTNIVVLLIINAAWTVIAINLHLFSIKRTIHSQELFADLFLGIFLLFLILASSIFLFKFAMISRLVVISFLIIAAILLTLWRFIFIRFLKAYRSAGYNYTRVIIVGAGQLGKNLHDSLIRHASYGYKFLGYFDDRTINDPKVKVLGKISDIYTYAIENEVDEIYVALPESAVRHTKELISFAENNLIRIKVIPDFRKFINRSVNIEFHESIPLISIRKEPLTRLTNRVIKRAFDILFSGVVILTIMSWLTPILAILIKLDSRGPVFFLQERNGENNAVFKMIKFRSMRVNKDSDTIQATRNDKRITKLGSFLRKSSLDELPQFFNVLMGNMSIVGPRPHMLKHTQEYSQLIDKYLLRQSIKPGITGWAQVRGYRGETTNPEMMRLRVFFDVWYMENWTFLLDIKIVYLTVFNMLKGEKNAG